MNKVCEWDGKIHIISDERFFALLTDVEYQVYCGLRAMAHNTGKKGLRSERVFDYVYISSWTEMSEELNMLGRKEGTIITRDTLRKTFNSLVKKGVLIKNDSFKDNVVYEIFNHNIEKYKFTRVDKELIEGLTKCLKGQVIKAYIYIKANFENNVKNRKETKLNRNTIAKAINEVNKKGEIGKRQVDNISLYIKLLYNIGLVDAQINLIYKDGKVESSILQINNVGEELKKLPKKRIIK